MKSELFGWKGYKDLSFISSVRRTLIKMAWVLLVLVNPDKSPLILFPSENLCTVVVENNIGAPNLFLVHFQIVDISNIAIAILDFYLLLPIQLSLFQLWNSKL